MNRLSISTAHLLALTLTLQGCISVRGGETPEVPVTTTSATTGSGEAISYDFMFLTRDTPNGVITPTLTPIVDRELRGSGAFRDVRAGNDAPTHVSIVVNNTGPLALGVITGLLSGLTLTVLPGYARDDYTMTATVTRSGRELKKYEYHDSLSTWLELFLVFGMPFVDGTKKKSEEILADMTRNLARDIQRDLRPAVASR